MHHIPETSIKKQCMQHARRIIFNAILFFDNFVPNVNNKMGKLNQEASIELYIGCVFDLYKYFKMRFPNIKHIFPKHFLEFDLIKKILYFEVTLNL